MYQDYSTLYSSTYDVAYGFAGVGVALMLVYCCVIVVSLLIAAFIYYRLAKKMGYNPWLGLLMLVPFVNLVLLYIVLFQKWPLEEEVERLRGGSSKPAAKKTTE